MGKRELIVKCTIPFCVKRCAYCTRAPIEGWDTRRMHAYMGALQREIAANAAEFADCTVTAIHLGGGLASMANAQDVSDTVQLLRTKYDVAEDASVTIRSAIANISGASMPFFKRAGITRFDFEMMSLSPVGYAEVNRRDALSDFPVVCDYFLHSHANDSLGIVLLAGHAKAGADNFRRSIIEFTRSDASHLIIQRCGGSDALPDSTIDSQIEDARDLLQEAGFPEYASLRFARPGKEDSFTLKRRGGCDQLSFGLGARSRIEGVETRNTADLASYCAHAHDFALITDQARPLAM